MIGWIRRWFGGAGLPLDPVVEMAVGIEPWRWAVHVPEFGDADGRTFISFEQRIFVLHGRIALARSDSYGFKSFIKPRFGQYPMVELKKIDLASRRALNRIYNEVMEKAEADAKSTLAHEERALREEALEKGRPK
jgi:hypothetical protein